jgi:hypothetical protein
MPQRQLRLQLCSSIKHHHTSSIKHQHTSSIKQSTPAGTSPSC